MVHDEMPHGGGDTVAISWRMSERGCRLAAAADVDNDGSRFNATLSFFAVLDDRPDAITKPGHGEQWADWLHWANVAQFLRGDDRSAILLTTTTAWDPPLHPLAAPMVAAPLARQAAPAELPEDWRIVAEYTTQAVRDLVRSLAARGVPLPQPGYEVGEEAWLVELAWPDDKLAVVIYKDDQRDAYMAEHGWHVVHGDEDRLREITDVWRGRRG